MKKIAIIIPCYNEANRLEQDKIVEFIEKNNNICLILVDDGSVDKTLNVISTLHQAFPQQIISVALNRNKGKPEAVRQGFLKAFELSVDYIGYWDADFATPLYHIMDMYDLIEKDALDIVIGSRVMLLGRKISRKPWRHILGRISATLASIILKSNVYDTQCGAKLFRNTDSLKQVFSFPFETRWIFDIEILSRYSILIRNLNQRIDDICAEYPLKEWGERGGSNVRMQAYVTSFLALIKIYRMLYLTGSKSRFIKKEDV